MYVGRLHPIKGLFYVKQENQGRDLTMSFPKIYNVQDPIDVVYNISIGYKHRVVGVNILSNYTIQTPS